MSTACTVEGPQHVEQCWEDSTKVWRGSFCSQATDPGQGSTGDDKAAKYAQYNFTLLKQKGQ